MYARVWWRTSSSTDVGWYIEKLFPQMLHCWWRTFSYLFGSTADKLLVTDIPLLSWQQHNVSGLLVSSLVNEWSSAILRYDKCSIQINIKILQDHLHPCVTLLVVWFSCKEWFQTLLQANEEVFQNVFNSFWVCCWSQLEYLKENWVFKMYSISTFCLWDNCNNFIRKSKQNLLWR